jgi:hypothetical protein
MSLGSVCAVSTHRTGGLALVEHGNASRLVAWGGVAAKVLAPPTVCSSNAATPSKVFSAGSVTSTGSSSSFASATHPANLSAGSTAAASINDWSVTLPASWGGIGRVVEPHTVLTVPWDAHMASVPRWATVSSASESAAAAITHKGDVWVWGYLQAAPPYPFTSNPSGAANSAKHAFVLLSEPRTGTSPCSSCESVLRQFYTFGNVCKAMKVPSHVCALTTRAICH